MKTTTFLFLITVLFAVSVHARTELVGDVYDAAFSPDGKTIGIGGDNGLFVVDSESFDVLHQQPTPGEAVHFLKWHPDGERLLYAQWAGEEVPTYSLFSLKQETAVFSQAEKIRWFGCDVFLYSNNGGVPQRVIKESTHPVSWEMAHPNAVAFDPTRDQMALLTDDNRIRVYDLGPGTLAHEFAFPDSNHLVSLGYSQDGRQLWAGTLDLDSAAQLLFLDSLTGEVLETKEGFAPVYDVTPDLRYLFTVTAIGDIPFDHFYERRAELYDLSTGKFVEKLAHALASGYYGNVVHRTCYSSDLKTVYTLEYTNERTKNFYQYNFRENVYLFSVPPDLNDTERLLVQPFSPNAEKILILDDNKLWVLDARTRNYREVVPRVSRVEEYRRHEWMLGEAGMRE